MTNTENTGTFLSLVKNDVGLCIVIGILLLVSLLFFTNVILMIVRKLRIVKSWGEKRIRIIEKHDALSLRTLLMFSTLSFFFCVWALRFAVDLFSVFHAAEAAPVAVPAGVSVAESVFRCFVHALQTVSLDEEFNDYIDAGKQMFGFYFNSTTVPASVYTVYASVLNFAVPLFGGAVLLELLSEFFPKVYFFFIRHCSFRNKYYFSELNEQSLALAKSIFFTYRKKVRFVFADVSRNSASEDLRDQIDEAKQYSAVCLRDDIRQLHFTPAILKKRKSATPHIFLIDDDENKNLQVLTELLYSQDEALRRAEIYVFQSDRYDSRLEEEVAYIINQKRVHLLHEKGYLPNGTKIRSEVPDTKEMTPAQAEAALAEIQKKEKKASSDLIKKGIPSVIPVSGVRNMACNLMMQLPLFEPLLHVQENPCDLHVVIFGSGVIGTEMFLTLTWCGQMLDCRLHITVISKEKQNADRKPAEGAQPLADAEPADVAQPLADTEQETSGEDAPRREEDTFEGRINRLNPDILLSGRAKSDLLRFGDGPDDFSAPYFDYHYVQADVYSDNLETLLVQKTAQCHTLPLTQADYYIVALGTDEDNFRVADDLRRLLGRRLLKNNPEGESEGTKNPKKTVIGYVIYNSELCRSLNQNCSYDYTDDIPDVYMRAFGSMDEVFSVNSVMFSDIAREASAIGRSYDEHKHGRISISSYSEKIKMIKSAEEKRTEDKLKRFKDIYSYYADLMPIVHRRYKIFSARQGLQTMGFRMDSVFELEAGKDLKSVLEDADKAYAKYIFTVEGDRHGEKQRLINRLSWLEHRRWCAYMRTRGFRVPEGGLETYVNRLLAEHEKKENKFVSLKLHPCLVECSDRGQRAEFDDVCIPVAETEYLPKRKNKTDSVFDCLDHVTLDMFKYDDETEDYKRWDHPGCGIAPKDAANVQTGEGKRKKYKEKSLSAAMNPMDVHLIGGEYLISAKHVTKTVCKLLSAESEKAEIGKAAEAAASVTKFETVKMFREDEAEAFYLKIRRIVKRARFLNRTLAFTEDNQLRCVKKSAAQDGKSDGNEQGAAEPKKRRKAEKHVRSK